MPYDSEDEFPHEEPDFDPIMDPVIPPDLHRSNRDKQEEGAFGVAIDNPHPDLHHPTLDEQEEGAFGGTDDKEPSIEDEAMITPVTNEHLDTSQYQSIGKGSEELDGDQSEQSKPSLDSPDRFSARDESPVSRRSERDPSPLIPRSPRQVSFGGRESASNDLGTAPRLTVEIVPSHSTIDVPDPSPRLDFVSPLSTPGNFSDFGETSMQESGITPQSQGSEYSRSSAMRGAQELLRKNRQQRLAIMAKRRSAREDTLATKNESTEKTVFSRSRNRSITPSQLNRSPSKKSMSPTKKSHNLPQSPSTIKAQSPVKMSLYRSPSSRSRISQISRVSKSNNSTDVEQFSSPRIVDDSDVKSEATSAVSASSSVWTDTTDLSEKDQRRALILRMAKNRMKSKRGSLAS